MAFDPLRKKRNRALDKNGLRPPKNSYGIRPPPNFARGVAGGLIIQGSPHGLKPSKRGGGHV